jgi:hypothetical protein
MHTIIEQALSDLSVPITFLRPAWFMENCRWDVAPADLRAEVRAEMHLLVQKLPGAREDATFLTANASSVFQVSSKDSLASLLTLESASRHIAEE